MKPLQTILAILTTVFALPAWSHDGVHINNPYARVIGGIGASGAVFFEIENHQSQDDRLLTATSPAAERVELHSHLDQGGVMKMVHVTEGFPIPANGTHALERGGDHVMLMGMNAELKNGDMIDLTLTFERAGQVQVQAVVDNERQPAEGAAHDMHGHLQQGETSGQHMANHSAHGHNTAIQVDTSGMNDTQAIAAIMKAQFETPESPLLVDPITVQGDHALASWAQDGKGGRALLERRSGAWVIVLCGGADLRLPAFLAQNGVSAAQALSDLFNAAEDALGADKVHLSSSFNGVVMISPKM